MPDGLDGSELQRELAEVNRALAGEARRLAAHLDSAEGRRTLAHVWGALQPERSTVGRLRAGARAFMAFIDLHPAGDGEPLSRIGIPIVPGQVGFTPVAARDAGQVLALGSLYLGLADLVDSPRFARLWDVMVGADMVNTILRHALVGKPLPTPRVPPRVPPDLFDYIRDFAERHCVAGVISSSLQLSQAMRGRGVTSNATGITALDPPRGCAGQVVTIRGTGFGSRKPANVEVYFPKRTGSCQRATVALTGWTDTAIAVIVPRDVGVGCVGFVVDGSTGGSVLLAADSLIGEVTSCFGPLFAESIRSLYENVSPTFTVPCPPCLPGEANRFTGGLPTVDAFMGRRIRDGVDHFGTTADLRPGDMLELRWRTTNATEVQISALPVNGHLHELPPLPGPFGLTGNQLVRWSPSDSLAFASFTWDAAYKLRAINACGSVTATVTVQMRLPHPDRPAPNDFLWGVATAGRQVEGNLTDDWEIFTTDPLILKRLQYFKSSQNLKINPQSAGSALNHWAWGEFVRSVERARALGLNAYRLSVEWSRIEPGPGRFDATALGNYQMMIDVVLTHGMEPVVVLNHLSLPAWVQTPPRETAFTCGVPGGKDSDPGYLVSLRGWETGATVDAYVGYVEYVVTHLRDVTWWITFNEPLATTVPTGYLASVFPPGFLGDGSKGMAAVHHIIEAHARAYESIHRLDPTARVGITDQWLHCKENLGVDATRQFVYYHQDLLINALVHGNEDRDISVSNPRYERVLGIAEEDWRPHLDFFGLQYYKSVYPYWFCGVAVASPWLGGRVDLDLSTANYPYMLLNDMGWEMNPVGLYDCLMKLKQIARWHDQDLPILVAENGTAEVVDHNRAAYVTAHLEELVRAQNDGSPVLGYLHWSISDNWEWIEGYRPEARFGLFSVALPASDPVHSIKDGALALSQAVANPPMSITDAVNRYGRYRADGAIVEHPTASPGSTWHGTLDGRPITVVLSALGPAPAQPPARQRNLTGMLFHVDQRRWVRLDEVIWESATRTLQFSYRGYAIGGNPLPERIFVGVLDPAGNSFTGRVTQRTNGGQEALAWQASRVSFVGAWQGHLSPNALITLSLSCPERDWCGRVLMAMDWLPLDSIQMQQWGFTARHGGNIVAGVYSLGEISMSPFGAGLRRLPDGLPF
jgi:beta-glucosidase/6-phospho-beta-glucosidase/beta-galactosidase